MPLYTAHLPKWKKDEISEIKKLSEEYRLTGLVDMYGIPARQVQDIRRNLKGKAELRMTRNTLIEHALGEIGGEIKDLGGKLNGHSALIFTNENPFKLHSMLEKTKTKMAARPGELSPTDIVVEKGPTSFKPGPIVGELQQAGIPAAIEAGKVTIRETKTVVKEGQEISKKLADALAKLDVKPMDVGLLLQAAFYEGTVYESDVLAIDEVAFYNNIITAATHAFNLSLNAAIPTKDTASDLLTKAVREARNVAVEAAVVSSDVMDAIIGKAQSQAMALQSVVE
ncbi:MAG TPA: 50S ribosomal protein L10 [Methanospirillum sp.]|jgi:large subunit ribosomal protein L10|uniref:50S ribosomal protein L10 n=1 Tax=Methanospirillum sp. TaxID=45200 RepID=UPI002B5283CF|nr:50S ribosomal protein L10 [Methanospirillum sp.]HWQ63769.1 50S ribosomal protein L10 [Methanospirillum sp.]